MTWRDYLEKLIESGASPDLAEMSVGHMMDLYESYDWDSMVPFEIKEV